MAAALNPRAVSEKRLPGFLANLRRMQGPAPALLFSRIELTHHSEEWSPSPMTTVCDCLSFLIVALRNVNCHCCENDCEQILFPVNIDTWKQSVRSWRITSLAKTSTSIFHSRRLVRSFNCGPGKYCSRFPQVKHGRIPGWRNNWEMKTRAGRWGVRTAPI